MSLPSPALPPPERRLRFLAIALAGPLLAMEACAWIRAIPPALRGDAAFRGFYDAGAALRSGHVLGLYRSFAFDHPFAFDHLGYEALLFAPLSMLTYQTAYFVFLVLNLALLALTIGLMRPYLLRLGRVWSWLPVGLFVCFFPVAMALAGGSDSILLMTLATASAVSFYQEREIAAGMLLGLALFDFQYAIPIALLFLLWRKWRIAAGFAVSALLIALLTAWLTHFKDIPAILSLFRNPSLVPRHAGVFRFALPNLRWIVQAVSGGLISMGTMEVITLVISAALLIWAATRPPNFALASAVALLVSYRGEASDLVLLVLPMSFVLLSRVAQVKPREMFSKYVMGAMFLTPSLLFFSPGAEYAIAVSLLLLLVPLRSLF